MEATSKRQYREENGVIYCDRRGCPGSKGLRCYRTDVPICVKCSVRTPVGYLSKDAAREQQNLFFNAGSLDYVIAGIVAFFASLVVGFFVTLLPIFYLTILLSFPAGGLVGEIVFRALRKRRGRYTGQVVVGAMVLSLFFLLPFTNLFNLLIYAAIAIGTATARVGIKV